LKAEFSKDFAIASGIRKLKLDPDNTPDHSVSPADFIVGIDWTDLIKINRARDLTCEKNPYFGFAGKGKRQ
jgi:hypothetical protein